ncbi:MAG: CorA family divalent cation transporter [Oscillospiraceae bacterium]|nr:CorA family divalent cation transporter [Oscillospiraceae bacterium]
MFRMTEQQVGRLQAEAQALREYGIQVRELFQAEIDIRQNRIMKILTIVTTIFLPLPLVAGW